MRILKELEVGDDRGRWMDEASHPLRGPLMLKRAGSQANGDFPRRMFDALRQWRTADARDPSTMAARHNSHPAATGGSNPTSAHFTHRFRKKCESSLNTNQSTWMKHNKDCNATFEDDW
uniref:Uncharacterized protein n=1 Tax=Panagrellus redivivus TaxID=6233 RepID=A0A7E4ZTC8_PANRE